MLIDKTFSQH